MLQFNINDQEVKHLTKADRALGELIQTIGEVTVPLRDDYFQSLATSIIGQQLSNKVVDIIYERVQTFCGQISPELIAAVPVEDLRSCGLSRPKISYLKELSQNMLNGDVALHGLECLPDEEVIRSLTRVKGIGRWTAEMFLIFSLGRLDIFSFADVGLKRSIQWLYQLDRADLNGPKPGQVISQLSETWRPYRTVASLYLWEAINIGLVDRNHKLSF